MEVREFSDNDLKWIKRLERVMKDAPAHLFMFVNGGIAIYPGRYMQEGVQNGAVDDLASESITIITPMQCDGGDY